MAPSSIQAISAATRNAAQFVGPQAEWGTIEPGKVADLVVVQGDPSAKIGDTRNVVIVIQAGRIVDRAKLRYDPRTEPDFHTARSGRTDPSRESRRQCERRGFCSGW